MRSSLPIALALLLAVGCGGSTRPCRSGTLFVTITYSGAASSADGLDLDVTIDNITRTRSFTRTAGGASDSVEVTFPSGFPIGKEATVTARARTGTTLVGSGTTKKLLDGSCGAFAIAIGAPSGDMAGQDMTGQDMTGQDMTGQDMTRPPDLVVLEDLVGRDLTGADLTVLPDMTALPDIGGGDQASPADGLVPPDATVAGDATSVPDAVVILDNGAAADDMPIVQPDGAVVPDMSVPDLVVVPDMALPPSVQFLVLRLGDGTLALSGTATAAFLERRGLDGSLLATIPLPTAASGANQPLTFSGSATSEGNLSLSENGAFVTFAGYGTPPGTTGVANTMPAVVNRVVGRVDAAGNVDTSTRIDTIFNSNVRSAATDNGSGYWVTGVAVTPNGGVAHIPHGAVGGAIVLTGSPANVRFDHVYRGQIYATSGTSPFNFVSAIGTGLPTTGGQTYTPLPNGGVGAASPYSFVLLDRDGVIPGVDTLYVADDRSTGSGGGILKFTFDGTSWLQAAFTPVGLNTGVRGLAGIETGATVTLVATTTVNNSNSVVVVVDDGSSTPPATPIVTAPANTVFRGIAFAPR